MTDKLIELGTCKKPHGIKGEFSFYIFNSEESILKKGSQIILIPLDSTSSLNAQGENFEIEQLKFGNKTICRLKGVTDRNQVEAMIPFSIQINRQDFPSLGEGEFYLSDLVGLDLIDAGGKSLGLVDNFYENGEQVVLVLKMAGKTIELPFVEAFFPELDLENRKITFIQPEEI